MKIRSKLSNVLNYYRYRHNAHPTNFNWNWREKGHNRIALVNYLVAQKGGLDCNYLEIGCENNSLFDSVVSTRKTGVDPASGGTHRMTSDEFFDANSEKFDVVFVDGLHEYLQVRRDALNALNSINNGGWIAFHDFLPSNWKEHHVPRISKAWTGDCWKFAVELAKAEGIEFYIVNIDCGVGLMRKTAEQYSVPDLSNELIGAKFDRFVSEVKQLPIIEYTEAVSIVGSSD